MTENNLVNLEQAFSWLNIDQTDKALSIFTQIFNDTEDPEALYGMAKCAYQVNDLITALTRVHELIDLDPEFAEAYNLCGMISREMDDLKSAKSFFILAIEKDPTLLDPQRNYGDVLLDLEDYDNGVQAYVRILENHPDDIPTLIRMSHLYLEVNQYQSALVYVGKVLEQDKSNSEALELFSAMQDHLEVNSLPVQNNW